MSATQVNQAVASFVVLMFGFVGYSTVAVPLIEGPPAVPVVADADAEQQQPAYEPPTARFQGLIDPLFPEGSWERHNAKILKSDSTLLLLKDYRALEDNRLHISPCTIVLLPKSPQVEQARTWVIQAIEGAIIEFERGVDIGQGQLGKILSAYIPGSVQIRGSPPNADAEVVEITSRNLQFEQNRIWTPHGIDFRIGSSFGSGRDLTILLNANAPTAETQTIGRLPTTMDSQIRSIELVQVDRLHIDPSDTWGAALDEQLRGVPIDIRCGGSLFVDMLSGVGRLSEQVQISRRASDTVFDQLDCDQLDANFGMITTSTASNEPDKLGIRRVAAKGSPATFATRQKPDDPLHRVQSPEFAYDFGSAGVFSATGPGQYSIVQSRTDPSTKERDATVSWQRLMRWQPTTDGGQLELEGRAHCRAKEFGSIEADRLGLHLIQPHSQSGHQASIEQLKPRRLWGRGDVVVNTAQLLARTRELNVDFLEAPPVDAAPAVEEEVSGPVLQPPQPNTPETRDGLQGGTSQFQVSGGSMQVDLAISNQRTELQRVKIAEGVRCLEVHGDGPSARSGVELRGDQLELLEFGQTTGTAVITGSPALIRARQMDIAGPAVHLDRKANRIWVQGAGTATLPLPEAMAKQATNQIPSAYLQWQNKMEFDGQTIRCGDSVELRAPTQQIRCAQLSGVLKSSIDLSASSFPKVAVDRIEATGGVSLRNRTLGPQGLESIDTATMQQVTVWHDSGQFQGVGPGSLETVRYGKNALLPQTPAGGVQQAAASMPNLQLIYLRVDFQRALEGNINERQVDFLDGIRAIYGPVATWNDRLTSENHQMLPKGGLLMRCDRLSVFQIVKRFNDGLPIEIVALGNVRIDGREFAAQAHRMSYDQDKDQIVLDGDGRSDARLWRHGNDANNNSAATQASKIQFWPGSNRVKVDGFRGLIWNQ